MAYHDQGRGGGEGIKRPKLEIPANLKWPAPGESAGDAEVRGTCGDCVHWKDRCNALQNRIEQLEAQLLAQNLNHKKTTNGSDNAGEGLSRRLRNAQGLKVTEANETGRHPLEIIPELAWKTIFDNLEDPKDLFNCSRASTAFFKVLSPSSNSWLFDQVLPLVFNRLEKREIWKCRLVCKGWARAVDFTFQNHPAWRAYDADCDFQRKFGPEAGNSAFAFGHRQKPHKGSVVLMDKAGIARFTEMALSCEPEINPIPSRTLELNFRLKLGHLRQQLLQNINDGIMFDIQELQRLRDDHSNFLELILGLLDACGNEIWNLSLEVVASDLIPFRNRLSELLAKVPNLRFLFILAGDENQNNPSSSVPSEGYQESSLPDLPHLEVLALHNTSEKLVRSELQLMTAYGQQIKKLVVRFKRNKRFTWENQIHLPQLTHLYITNNVDGNEHARLQRYLEQINAKLEKLSLNIWNPHFFQVGPKFLYEMDRLGVEVLELILARKSSSALDMSMEKSTRKDVVVPSLRSLVFYQRVVRISEEVFQHFPSLTSIHHRTRDTFGDGYTDKNMFVLGTPGSQAPESCVQEACKIIKLSNNSPLPNDGESGNAGAREWQGCLQLVPSLKEITFQEVNHEDSKMQSEVKVTGRISIGGNLRSVLPDNDFYTSSSRNGSSSESSSESDSDSEPGVY